MAKVGCGANETGFLDDNNVFSYKHFSTFKLTAVPSKIPLTDPHVTLACCSSDGEETVFRVDEKVSSGCLKKCRKFELIDDKQRSTLSLKLCPGPVLWVKNGKGSFLGSIRKDDNRYLCLDNKGCDLFFIRFNKKGEIEEIEFTKESSSPFAVGKVMKVKKKSGRYFDAAIIDFVRSIDRKNVSELYLLQSLTISSLFLISNLYCRMKIV